MGERFITLTLSELNISSLIFEVQSLTIDPISNAVEVGLIEVESTDFDFDAATEEGTPPPIPADTEITPSVPVPAGLALAVVQTTGSIVLSAGWNEDLTRPDLTVEAQYRNTNDSSWLPLPVSQEQRSAISGPLVDGEEYGVRIRNVTLTGRVSSWSTEIKVTANQTETAPSTPTEFTTTLKGSDVDIGWRNPNEANFSYVDIHRRTSDDFGSSSTLGPDQIGGLGELMTYRDVAPGSGTFYYWVVARTDSGLSSNPTASENETLP